MYASMSKVTKSPHRIRLTHGIKQDLRMWQIFLNDFNGVSYMLDIVYQSVNRLPIEIRKIAICFLWLSLPGGCEVAGGALLAETA